MKKAKVLVNGIVAGHLIEIEKGKDYEFHYLESYRGSPVSLTMPLTKQAYLFKEFPAFFEGFLPEGMLLECLLKKTKLDSDDLFEQLMRVGKELVGNITLERDL